MPYWKKPNNNIERFEDDINPGKIKELIIRGHIRVKGKDDPTPYEASTKKKSKKKK
jgi:hypothetical protein